MSRLKANLANSDGAAGRGAIAAFRSVGARQQAHCRGNTREEPVDATDVAVVLVLCFWDISYSDRIPVFKKNLRDSALDPPSRLASRWLVHDRPACGICGSRAARPDRAGVFLSCQANTRISCETPGARMRTRRHLSGPPWRREGVSSASSGCSTAPATRCRLRLQVIQVYEDYRDFEPSVEVRARVEMLLGRLTSAQAQGLGSVVLTNQAALSRAGRRQKTWNRGRKVPLASSLGSYHRAWKGEPAWIRILVDNTLAIAPRWAHQLPAVATVCVASVLYHEVGHHIHATTHPEYREREDVAEEWSKRLTRELVFDRYWYVAVPLAALIRVYRWFVKRRTLEWRGSTTRP